MESGAKEGESPVGESKARFEGILSTTGHEESGRKQAGPSAKAKYNK